MILYGRSFCQKINLFQILDPIRNKYKKYYYIFRRKNAKQIKRRLDR